MNAKQICGVIVALCVAAVAARADSLELKNGSLIKGKFMGGAQTSISFQVGSSVQSYDVADVRSLRFDSEAQGASPSVPSKQPSVPSSIEKQMKSQNLRRRSPFLPVHGFRFAPSIPLTRPGIAWDFAFRLRSKNLCG